jgi:hypothetical protein
MCCLNTFTAAITVQNQYSSNWWRGSDRTIYIELTFWGAAYILKGGGQSWYRSPRCRGLLIVFFFFDLHVTRYMAALSCICRHLHQQHQSLVSIAPAHLLKHGLRCHTRRRGYHCHHRHCNDRALESTGLSSPVQFVYNIPGDPWTGVK